MIVDDSPPQEIPVPPGRVERARQRLPSRRAVYAYWGFAHCCLLTALLALALDPAALAGFPYQPKMVAVVHLVTLGWVTCSIFGALHLMAPMALRSPVAPRRLDLVGFALIALGVAGMATHFWIDQVSGMAWSGLMVSCGFVIPVVRFWRAVGRAQIPVEVKLHYLLAFVNLGLTAAAGLLLATNKLDPWIGTGHLPLVWGHAHLAGVGWALMMVMASAYRLLPMFLPAAMPTGRWVWASALLVEIGVLGLAAALAVDQELAAPFIALVVAGLACFAGRVRWMLANRKPAPPRIKRPDFAMVQVAVALTCLLISVAMGVALTKANPVTVVDLMPVYGVVFLLGFLAQLILGIAGRLLPLATWLWTYADSDYQQPPPSPLITAPQGLQAVTLITWLVGVPCLAAGLSLASVAAVRLAAVLLLAGLVASAGGHVLVARRLRSPVLNVAPGQSDIIAAG